ncbi:MAG: hypothetical protein DYG89_09250 [Caldilinea sp. CFX5]|nr:hypothetical protein [Caldilinea sp. CFX5]
MSTLFRRFVYLFTLAALLFTNGFPMQPAFAQRAVAREMPPKPDLIVTTVDFTNICSAKFTIRNIGLGAANVSFRFNAYPVPDITRWSAPILGLPAGGVATQTWQNVKTFEAMQITVVVDPDNWVQESDEENNEKTFRVPVRCQLWN